MRTGVSGGGNEDATASSTDARETHGIRCWVGSRGSGVGTTCQGIGHSSWSERKLAKILCGRADDELVLGRNALGTAGRRIMQEEQMQRSAGRLLHAGRRQKGAWTRTGAGRKAGRGLRTSVLPVCLMSDYRGQ